MINRFYVSNEIVDIIYNEGTIIDFETIGDIDNEDENPYKKVRPFIFGTLSLNNGMITQWYVKKEEYINYMNDSNDNFISKILYNVDEPRYAFSSQFEKAIIKNITGKDYEFRELQKPFKLVGYHEKKEYLCKKLMIDNHDDPFNGDGSLCVTEFKEGKYKNSLKHNRACLLKEYDILISRGYYKMR